MCIKYWKKLHKVFKMFKMSTYMFIKVLPSVNLPPLTLFQTQFLSRLPPPLTLFQLSFSPVSLPPSLCFNSVCLPSPFTPHSTHTNIQLLLLHNFYQKNSPSMHPPTPFNSLSLPFPLASSAQTVHSILLHNIKE